MRKVVSVLCLFLLFSTIGYGQKSFGVKAGLNVTRLHVNEAYTFKVKNRYGYHLGIWKEFTTVNPKIFIRPELFYTQKGFRNSDTLTSPLTNTLTRYKRTTIYNYLTLPLLVGYRLNNNFAVFVGPEFSTLIATRIRGKGEKAHNMRPIINYENPDFGLTAGFRYKLNSKLNADFRYTYGFSTILEFINTDAQGYSYTAKQNKNQAAQLGLSYTLKTKEGKI